MISLLSLWFSLGIVRLLILTYQDFKNKMMIDDRHNYFMIGATAMLITSFNNSLWYYLALVPLIVLLRYFLIKIGAIGKGDGNTILWMFTGFGIINPYSLVAFLFIFTVFYVIHFLFRRLLFRRRDKIQGYPVFLISFIAALFFVRF